MKMPLLLLGLSLCSLGSAMILQGPEITLWSVISALVAAVSLMLLVAALLQKAPSSGSSRAGPGPDVRPRIVVDGSNVLYWDNEAPRLETVARVVQVLKRRGLEPGVIFDANVGYKVGDRYLGDAELALSLGLAEDQVMVVPKGTVADLAILQAARSFGARIVSNDKFRDWEKDFPEIRGKGQLLNGAVRKGKLWVR